MCFCKVHAAIWLLSCSITSNFNTAKKVNIKCFPNQAALKEAKQTYGGRGEEIAALRMEAEVSRFLVWILVYCVFYRLLSHYLIFTNC